MKRFTSLFLAALLLITALALPASAKDELTVDGKPVSVDVQPMVQAGVLMVPIRPVAEALGGQVTWDQDKLTATIKTGNTTVILTAGKTTAQVNGHETPLALAVGLQGNQLMVPAGFLIAVYGERVTINSAGLKDPTAVALLEKAQKALPSQMDLQLDHYLTLDAGDPDALAVTVRAHISTRGQVRGSDALLTTTLQLPKAFGGPVSLLTAVKGGKAFVKAPGSKWEPLEQISELLAMLKSMNALQGLGAAVREAHLGDTRTVGGQRVQDVGVTYDVAALKSMTDRLLKGALPQDVPVAVNWDSATAAVSLDTATGASVGPQTADVALSIALPAELSDVPLRIHIHQVATVTPNDKPIDWPADLPK